MNMRHANRELVLKKVAATFPDPVMAEQAIAALDGYGSHPNQDQPVFAVQLAIIKLSNGSLSTLRELVRTANHDFRDVLYPAQAPEEFQRLRENPPPVWGEIRKATPLTPIQERAMRDRDLQQWLNWLDS
jgi:hypothetical protein